MVRSIIHNLPPFIFFEGITFQFAILGTSEKSLQIVYIITEVRADSKHFVTFSKNGKWLNRFENNALSKSLITSKDIRTDAEFRISLHSVWSFLRAIGIINKPILKTYEYEKGKPDA